ncbi:MAG: hypothetical protein A2X94_04125 [Bdellovibrionales bacterium GWB1_55_8]|nr:MAG: hypothetical protein A2X94_04125 [Bdellovibrionales bacterium GWB1_55_8]
MGKKWVAVLTAVVPLVAVTTLCASTWASDGKSLRFRLSDDPVTLDWNLASSSHETHVIMNLMEGLVEEGPDLAPRPALAERWEISPDGKTYTFTIRADVTWSDGKPLIAAHFRDSWLRLLAPKTRSSYASFLFDIENAEAYHLGTAHPDQVGIRVLSEQKLQVQLRRVVPHFLHLPSFWVTFPIRTDLISKSEKNWTSPKKLVTLGPYLLSEWKKGSHIRLKKNPSYRGWTAASDTIDDVTILILKDDKKARQLFREGKLDFFLDATTEDLLGIAPQKQGTGTRLAQFPYLATYYLGFNVTAGPLRDPAIRRAIAAAVDREKIGSTLQGGQIPARCWVPPGILGHQAGGSPEATLFEARATLAKAGFADGRGFPSLQLFIRKFDGADKLGDFLRASLQEKLGIRAEVSITSPAEFDRGTKSGKAALFVGHWGADFPDPANFYEVFNSQSGANRTRWKDTEYDSLVKAAGATLDSSARMAAYSKAEDILLHKDAVIVPLFFRRNVALLGPRVRKLEISPLNYLFLKTVELESSNGA